MLSSPIILYDYPQVSPESQGNYFDATEIDELLALSVMTRLQGRVPAQEALANAAPEEGDDWPDSNGPERQSLAQRVRNWLGRAA